MGHGLLFLYHMPNKPKKRRRPKIQRPKLKVAHGTPRVAFGNMAEGSKTHRTVIFEHLKLLGENGRKQEPSALVEPSASEEPSTEPSPRLSEEPSANRLNHRRFPLETANHRI
ncbi:unnamed protein product [Cuscuta epithymum]|uniref:Uncharacterized protein n=1 Tax=Cuscuta epithymum TaxID=186058 RepID=A0AAV0DMT9_9ASTE|nr:unnamed protein product [Cuscuta epithymum]